MAWNEPGGNKQQDPWSNNNRGNRGGNGGPPDLDEALKQFQDKLRDLFGGGSSGGSKGGDGIFGPVGAIGVIALLLYIFWGAYQLDEQEKAVVLRLGTFKEIVGSGFHWNFPIIDKVYDENVTRVRTHSSRGRMLTEDENIVEVDLSVQYNIADLKKYKLSIRDPEGALQEATESALRHVVGSSKMDDVLTTGREKIATEVKIRLEQYLDAYDTGIAVSSVNVEKTQAPSEVQSAFDDVIKAREDEQRVQNEAQAYANQIVPEARGKAKRMEEEAWAYHDQVIARAEGEADRFDKLLTEYKKAPQVTRERLYIDTVQQVLQNASKIMVDVKGGNNMMYLPLDKLLHETPALSGNNSKQNNELESLQRQLEALKRELNQTNPRRREVR
jgi:membrane protease subunit HflK